MRNRERRDYKSPPPQPPKVDAIAQENEQRRPFRPPPGTRLALGPARRRLPALSVQVLLHARAAAVDRHVDLRDLQIRLRVDQLRAVQLVVRALGREDLVLFFQREVRPPAAVSRDAAVFMDREASPCDRLHERLIRVVFFSNLVAIRGRRRTYV